MGQALVNSYAKRLLLIDDDPIFCGLLAHYAETQGVSLHYYNSLLEFGHMREPIEYDAVILDFDMGAVTGLDSASYISGIFGNIPILLVSGMPEEQIQPHRHHGQVGGFLQKSEGCMRIIDAALTLSSDALVLGWERRELEKNELCRLLVHGSAGAQ